MKIKVSISDQLTQEKLELELLVLNSTSDAEIKEMHKELERKHPNACVNFDWDNNFIYGMPLNQRKDEERVDNLDITFDEYMEKWYSLAFSKN